MFLFRNIGNTCYLNAVLQSLFRLKPLNEVLDATAENVAQRTEQEKFFHQFNDLRKICLQNGSGEQNCMVAPHLFFQAVQSLAKHKNQTEFSARQQNDAAEFMQFILNCLHEAMARQVDFDVVELADPIAIQCRETMKRLFAKECSDIIMLFYGMQVSTINGTNTTEPFLFLDLPIPEGAATLEHCLNAYIADETIEGWADEKTGTTRTVTKEMRLWRLPPVMTLVIKRFGVDGRKNSTPIFIPMVLAWGEDTFDLQSVCAHKGHSLNSGHYVTHCRTPSGWCTVDDEMVQPCGNVSQDAYCVIYVQRADA